jgi:glycosyltransferase involved in cell wall biosynthesis
LGASTDDQIVLALARQEPQKGLETLIDAVPRLTARFPKLRVLVAGREGSVSRNLDRRIEELGVGNTVKLLGHRSDVPELLCAADVLVFPSRWEGLGGSIIEALALECPIACTDLAVLREVAQAHAEYFEAGSPDALAAAVGRVLDGGTEIERRTAAGRQLFLDRYTTGIVSQQMVDFYRDCLRSA